MAFKIIEVFPWSFEYLEYIQKVGLFCQCQFDFEITGKKVSSLTLTENDKMTTEAEER